MKEIIKKAIFYAKRAAKRGEVPVAAVIFDSKTKEIISVSANHIGKTSCACDHAEVLAIRKASKKLNSRYLAGASIYVTLEPCPMCAVALSFAKIDAIYFGAYDIKGGGIENGCQVFANQPNLYKPLIQGGIEEEETSAILSNFFKNLRAIKKQERKSSLKSHNQNNDKGEVNHCGKT